jgi:hypothetical protein
MKKILSVLMIGSICLSAKAQKLYIQGGVSLANITETSGGHTQKANMLTTFNAGLMLRLKIPGIIGIETGLLLTGRGSKTETYFPNAATPDAVTGMKSVFNPIYLEVPLNMVIKLSAGVGPSVFLHAGPYVAMGVGGKAKSTTYGGIAGSVKSERKIDFSDKELVFENEDASFSFLRKYDYGINIGGGINFKKLMIKANYGLGLARISSSKSFDNQNDNRNKYRTISFSLGVPLGL